MNDNRIKAMIALKLAGWVQGVGSSFIGFVRISVGSYFDLHGMRMIGVGGY